MPIDILFPFRWQDFADILVVSVIVHRLFILLRGTTALHVMLGLLFIWLFQAIAKSAGLILTSWFFQGVGAIAVLAVVVVFRNEIRELFLQTNPIRFFLGSPRKTQGIDINTIAKTVFRLANTRTGAIVVIQNRDKLRAQLREGYDLDAKLNAQIIESIFLKQSPVHDGAIIIRGNRIKRVGTFLPLTQKEGLSQYYGSRHRAAIGLSEVSDAVVLVVSEERGDVSLVRRGKVELMRGPQQLQDELGRLLLGTGLEKEAQQRTRAWLAYAGGLLLTLLLVSTFWGIYTGGQLSLISITAPIDFRNIPENLELKKASAEKVKVQITGKRRLINALKPEQVRAFLDLQETNQGVRRMSLNRENIEVPLGLELVRASPSTIRLELEQRVEKEVAVKPEIAGILPAGYQIAKISVSPEAVKISGPKSTLRAIKTLNTEQVDLGKMETLEGKKVVEVPLVISPASLRLVPGQPREVQLYIQFASKKPTPDQPEERKTRYHDVRAGETLWGISRRYGLTIDELRRLNELAPGTVIYPGQNLKLGPANRE